MIDLRQLKEKDAPLMLEWMHDPEIAKSFRKNMMSYTLDDALAFCASASIPESLEHEMSIHYAIVDTKDDEYLGTISLKDIDLLNRTAEYAISTRKCAHGKGIAYTATCMILKKAFEEFGLNRVYLNVLSTNSAAIRLYERSGFISEGTFRQHCRIGSEYVDLKWYGMLKKNYEENTLIH